MRPLDPRLLRYASAARRFLVAGSLISLLQAVVTVAFAWFLSQSIAGAIDGRPLPQIAAMIAWLALVTILRAGLVWSQEVVATRGAAAVKSQLRGQVMRAVAERGPDWLATRKDAAVATVVTTGLDALDNYFARYLPQLLLTVIATPVLVAVMLWHDLPSGITVIVALPLIPVFMVLIGWATQAVQRRQWESMQRLGAGFLDLVGGLGTLKIFGREHRQSTRMRAVTEDYRQRTMAVLRVSFLSGFVLELAASLSVALVAVSIGLRLVDGQLLLATGLFVLLLAPEAFLPIRNVGTQFHAAADGVAAAEEVFEILDAPVTPDALEAPSAADARPVRGLRGALQLENVSIQRGTDLVLDGFDAVFRPGELSVVSGPSGVGKSSLVAALQGFLPFDGRLSLGGEPVSAADRREWLAWAGQQPGLFGGTVADNVVLGERSVDSAVLARALDWAGAASLDPEIRLDVNGSGLSGGQAQRVAAARAIYRSQVHDCGVVVFDEPSSSLDEHSELALTDGLKRLADQGRVVIVVSHRPAMLVRADQVVRLGRILRPEEDIRVVA